MHVVKALRSPKTSPHWGFTSQAHLRTQGRCPPPPRPVPLQPPPARARLSSESLANWPGLCAETHLEQMFPRLNAAPGRLDKSREPDGGGAGRGRGAEACVCSMGSG